MLCLSLPLMVGAAQPARAQVLAQKNWAGSGVSVEVWWKRAVFYRIDPTKFQDTTGSGKGDLEGITQRLDYLQALGVDAVIVETAPGGGKATLLPAGDDSIAFDTLVRDAVARHLRVLVDLGAPISQQADTQYVQMARAWLNQGAAGVFVPTQALEKIDGGTHIALLLQQLRAVTNSFPGDRVLLADRPAKTDDAMLMNGLTKYAQLTASAPLGAAQLGTGGVGAGGAGTAGVGAVGAGGVAPTVTALRQQWLAALGDTSESAESAPAPAPEPASKASNPSKNGIPTKNAAKAAASSKHGRERRVQRHEVTVRSQATGNPMLVAVRMPAIADPVKRLAMERALAVMLLASRSAVLLEFGQELGLENAAKGVPLMQWTPTNETRKPEASSEAAKPEASASDGYSGFRPWVKPLPRNFFPPPPMPFVEEIDMPSAANIAAMPGFTGAQLDAGLEAPNGASSSAVTEAYDPGSLLNLYKQLIRLHHDNATVRSGAQTVLNRDEVGALVWVRHAPANSRTSSTVVAGCNLSDRPVVLTDVGGVAMGGMRSLLQPPPRELMKMEPGMVMVGETR